jgi:pterin-4a-carbinolamine dehydratase
MKSLIEQIRKNSCNIKEDFDFTAGMKNLFSSNVQGVRDIPEMPIEATDSNWEEVSDFSKTYLSRSFFFEKHKHLRFFVSEILKESDELMHHPHLEVSKDNVKVILYTHDINDVSELDLKLAKFIDEIYDDVKFIEEF